MSVAPSVHTSTRASTDQRVYLRDLSWADFERFLEIRGEAAGPRVTYLDGELELMSPGKDHERIKGFIGCLIEAYALENDIDLSPYGAWLIEEGPKKAGLEPDECYILGSDPSPDRPDLAIEVVWTSDGLYKLEAYRRLGVKEVWFWIDDGLSVHVLEGDAYVEKDRSHAFPGLDLDLVVELLELPTAMQAVKALRERLGED